MLTTLFSTARKAPFIFALAVLFSATAICADSSLVQLEDRINDLIYGISRSVVTVEVVEPQGAVSAGFSAIPAVHTLVSTGLICDTLGHIIVSASSISGHDVVTVRYDSRSLQARVVGIDYRTGLALLDAGGRVGRPARLSPRPKCAGQVIVAVGNAYGVRVSPSLGFCAGFRPDGLMQFSAQVTSGSVGGGVFDLSGLLIGVIAGGIGPEQNPEVGLAVSATEIPGLISHLTRFGDRLAGYIGIRAADFEISPGIEIPSPITSASTVAARGRIIERGVIITGVASGSPAARAGLRSGDLIFAIDGFPVGSAAELQAAVRDNPPGMGLEISYLRHDVPYVVGLSTAASASVTPPGESSSSQPSVKPLTATDSLRLEVDRLKRAVRDLEQKLR